ncbi:MAG: helix-turn-helix transcriptional regulator [Clostridia bacterium]|nr:helix-turn-helix transcriptional regulator [Clostridia bacterium]
MENSELISKALDYIRQSASNSDLTVENVACNAGFSTDYFGKIFLAHTGFTVMEYARFVKLRQASKLLATTDKDILDIALTCGYESHEAFTRAFKKQYDQTPREYREKMRNTTMYYGDIYPSTIGNRLMHKYPQFKLQNRDEAIDYLLEKDAIRWGHEAVTIRVNGSTILCENDSLENGFISATEWGNDGFELMIFTESTDQIVKYLQLFSNENCTKVFCSTENEDTIRTVLNNRGFDYHSIQTIPCKVCRNLQDRVGVPQNVSLREVIASDWNELQDWAIRSGYNGNWMSAIHSELFRERTPRSPVFGVYRNDVLIGLAFGGFQETHAFVVNNCVYTALSPGEDESIYRYVFQFMTNEALKRGAVPFDDIQYQGSEAACGAFDSAQMGYETMYNRYVIK